MAIQCGCVRTPPRRMAARGWRVGTVGKVGLAPRACGQLPVAARMVAPRRESSAAPLTITQGSVTMAPYSVIPMPSTSRLGFRTLPRADECVATCEKTLLCVVVPKETTHTGHERTSSSRSIPPAHGRGPAAAPAGWKREE